MNEIREFFRQIPMQLTWVHSEVVEKILEKENVFDVDAKDILTNKLLHFCKEIERNLSTEEAFRKGLFLWDWVFLKTLIKIGPSGKEFAKQILPKLESDFIRYCESTLFSQYENSTSMLLILGEAIWLDIAKNLWIRKKKMFRRCRKEYGSLRSNLSSIKKLISH